jgi:hypothetical protein
LLLHQEKEAASAAALQIDYAVLLTAPFAVAATTGAAAADATAGFAFGV